MNISSTRSAGIRSRAVVSAYIDGKSQHIEALKLNAVDRLEKAQENSQGALSITLDGQRHSRLKDAALFAITGLAPAALAAVAGFSGLGAGGALLGGALGVAAFTVPAGYFLRRSLKAPQWKPETRWTPPAPAQPTPVTKPGAQRLRSLVDQSGSAAPEARKLLFLSGHGNRTEVAHIQMDELASAMKGSNLDLTILDACLQGQLEVMTRLAPWAGLVLASPHKIKARGFDLEKMLRPEILNTESDLDMARLMTKVARATTPSFAVIDSEKLSKELLPSLGDLGRALALGLDRTTDRKAIKNALKDSLGTDGLVSRRVDLGSFLKNLKKQGVLSEQTHKALESFSSAVPFQENEHSLSFHLKAGRDDETLPAGWREFLTKLDCGFKPVF